VEPKTALQKMITTKKVKDVNNEDQARQFLSCSLIGSKKMDMSTMKSHSQNSG
jgi:hypothetical protein